MGKRIHTNYTKNNFEKDNYRNMVKQPSKDFQDTNDDIPFIFEETSNPLKFEETETKYDSDTRVTQKPISTRFIEFVTEHIIAIAFSIVGLLATWNITLQISDAVKV